MNNRTGRAAKGVFTSLIQFATLILLQALLAPTILKIAGQDVLGSYAIVMQIIGYGLILDFGLGVALSRFLSQSFAESDGGINFIKTFNSGRYLILLSNTLIAIFILIVSLNINYIISSASDEIVSNTQFSLILLSAWSVLRSPLILYGYSLHSTQNMATHNIIGLASSLSRLFLSLYLVYLGAGLIGLVLANIVSECIGLTLQKYYFNRLFKSFNLKWKKPNITLFKKLLYFGLTYWGVNFSTILSIGSDSIIVGHLYGAAAASIIYTTKIPSFLIIQIIYKIVDNSTPAVNELISIGKYEALKIAYLKILRYSLLLALPASIGILVFNKQFIALWVGIDQYAGNIITTALAFFILTQVINHINAMVLVASGNMKHWMALSIFNGIVTIILSYFLGRNFGMQWVIVGIVIMDIPTFIFLSYRSLCCLKISYTDIFRKSLFPVILQSFPLIIFAYFLMSYNINMDTSEFISHTFIFIIIWLVSLLLFGIDTFERKIIVSKFFLILNIRR
jgi:O-antigen/teichoic acid export membrane protein